MSSIIKFPRRHTGAAGPPSSIKSGQPMWNGVDQILYLGVGDDGNGNALSALALAGPGQYYTKSQIDSALQGLRIKSTAQWATAAVLPNSPTYANGTSGVGATLTAGANAALAVDGGSPAVGDLVVVKNQVAAFQNGLYKVTATGSGAAPWVLTRSTEMDLASEFSGAFIPVAPGGTVNAKTMWLCNPSGAVTIGTTDIPFTPIGAINIIDNLTAGGTNVALSAEQGKTLKTLVDLKLAIASIIDDLQTGGSAVPLSAEQGKVLATQQTGINTRTSSYTLSLGDAGKIVEMDVGTANNLTIPANTTTAFPIKTRIDLCQLGAGQTTVVAAAGVTLRSIGSKVKLAGQYAGATLYKRGPDEWVLIGDLTNT